jgi:oligoendopeptidase F
MALEALINAVQRLGSEGKKIENKALKEAWSCYARGHQKRSSGADWQAKRTASLFPV